jgi:pheromone shutdown-related protein TraB
MPRNPFWGILAHLFDKPGPVPGQIIPMSSISTSEIALPVAESGAPSVAAEQPMRVVERDGVRYTLIGTAHVSRASAEAVARLAGGDEFDAIAVELCPARYDALKAERKWTDLDLFKVIKEGKAGLVMANLALSAYQRRIAEQFGIEPGAEMRAAAKAAIARDVPLLLVDRDLALTLRRSYASVPWYKRFYLMSGLLAGLISSDEIDEEQVEKLKEGDILESTFTEFASHSPELYRALIAERDQFMAARLREEAGTADPATRPRNVLVVIGAGHMAGLAQHLQDDVQAPASVRSGLEQVPAKARWPQTVPWIIMVLVLAGFAIGFSRSPEIGWNLVFLWVVIIGSLAGVGALVARAHPLTILSGIIAAPITVLNPAVAAGMVTGLVESWLRKPKVADLERLHLDITSVKGWFSNRATRVLLVFFFTNLGAAIGAWVAGFKIFETLS